VRRYLRDPTFSCFDTIPECDGHTHTHTQTDGQTDTRRRHIPRLARRHAVKIGNVTYSKDGIHFREGGGVGVGWPVQASTHL